jgi:hypothetical protein
MDWRRSTPCTYQIALAKSKKGKSALNNPTAAQQIMDQISSIFRQAGLDVVFGSDNPDYTLVVADQVPSDMHVTANAIGYTTNGSGLIYDRGYVWEARLEQFDKATLSSSTFLGIGLGRAGAHEIAHDFLQCSHGGVGALSDCGTTGLMRPSFSDSAWHTPDTAGNFTFTPEQAAQLQRDCKWRRAVEQYQFPGASLGSFDSYTTEVCDEGECHDELEPLLPF